MINNEKRSHDLALIAAKAYIKSNSPEYLVVGYSKLVADLAEKYSQAYDELEKHFSDISK